MLKLYFVGDLHLHDVSPSSRIDDYSQAILDKLSQVFTKAKESNVDAIIFEGDIFHKPSGISVRYLNKVIDVFKEAHCPCYSVIGNHDVQYGRIDDIGGTSLGVLFKAGLLKQFFAGACSIPFMDGKVLVEGYNYGEDISQASPSRQANLTICVAHSYGEDVSFGAADTPEYFKFNSIAPEVPYNVYVLGHDHSYHDTMDLFGGLSKLYRLGALSRATSSVTDTSRDVQVLELDINEDGSYIPISVHIDINPAEDCFSALALDKDMMSKRDRELINKSLEEVLANLDFSVKSSIYDILDAMDLDDNVKATVERYLNNAFIVRK